MSDDDLYFTHAIVGAPQTVFLGDRVTVPSMAVAGMQVDLHTGHSRMSEAWQDWMVMHRRDPANGLPLRRPSPLMRWLVRHTLLLGIVALVAGLAALIAAIVVHYT